MIRFFKELRSILNTKQRTKFYLYIIFSIIGSILELIGISLFLPFINFIINPQHSEKYFFSNILNIFHIYERDKIILLLSIVLLITYVIKNLILSLFNYYKFSFINTTQKELYTKMISFYLEQPYIFHVNNNSATLQRNILNDCGQFIQVLQNFCDLLVNLLITLFIAGYLIYIDIYSMLIVTCVFSIILLLFYKPYNKTLISYGRVARDCGAHLVKIINESLGGVKEIKVKGVIRYFINYFSTVISKSSSAQKKNSFLSSLPKYVIETIVILILVSMVIYKILVQKVSTNVFVAEMSVFAFAFIKLLPSITSLSSSFSGVCYNSPSLHALYKEIQKINNSALIKVSESKNIKLEKYKSITLRDVYFSYPKSKKEILKGINIIFEKGKFYAFIGESGSGKTTLIDVILNLLDIEKGEILINDINRNKISKENWFSYFGYIPQFVYLMDCSIRENIAFGENSDSIDDAKVLETLKIVKLDKIVKDLPNGIYENIGENGSRLSGGQRQRLGIARALYQDKPIIILDEATSALDSVTEDEILKIIDDFKGEKTVIMVAHKLNTIKNCDFIYKVKDGSILLSN